MMKPNYPTLTHPLFGDCINVTEPDSSGKRQRLSESGHTVIDIKLANGEKRVLLLSSFAAQEPPPSVAVIETPAPMAA